MWNTAGMVRAIEEEQETLRSRLNHFKGMQENAGRQTRSLIHESSNCNDNDDSFSSMNDRVTSRSHASVSLNDQEKKRIGSSLNRNDGGASSPKSRKPSGN